MERQKAALAIKIILAVLLGSFCFCLCGCDEWAGYSTESLFADDVSSVYVEMFDNRGFERGVEYELTDALAKQIEAATPYKIVSNADRADTILTGYIGAVGKSILSIERETGRGLEREILITATVNWKNLKSGELLIDAGQVTASATYSQWQNQGKAYGSALAANRLAKKIVELMEKPW